MEPERHEPYKDIDHEIDNGQHYESVQLTVPVEDPAEYRNDGIKAYAVQYCYLFGSYAKGKATERSDVDLLVSSETTGLRFYELAEKLREKLRKKIDLLDVKQLAGNSELLNEVLKDGIRIYG